MDNLETHYRKQFDQPTGPILDQLKFILRIWQSQGHSKQVLPFLLMLESILEKGDREESLRTKLLRLLQTETKKTTREELANEHEPEINITANPDAGTYTLFARSSNDPTETTAQRLLNIAAWVEQHRDQLRKDAGQELLDYRVKLYASRVRPLGSTVPELSIEALNAQEAVGRALLNSGVQEMKVVVVISSVKEESFSDVKLQADQSITFAQHEERWQPQPLHDTQK
jgi:hypothetical protein